MNGKDLIIEITRDKFEDLCIDLFQKCLLPIENALKDANMNKYQVNTIILTGGSSRIPKIQTMIKEYFDGNHIIKYLNSDEVVSSGAAIQAAIMSNIRHKIIYNFIFMDVIPHSIGLEIEGGVMNVMIPRAHTIPCKKSQIFFTSIDNQFEILLKVYEGEEQLTKDNLLIDKIRFDGLPPGPKGHILVEITLDIDANFNIELIAIEKITGKYKNKKICFVIGWYCECFCSFSIMPSSLYQKSGSGRCQCRRVLSRKWRRFCSRSEVRSYVWFVFKFKQ